MPAPSRLMKPARIMSLWLMISASAGASLSVAMKNWVALMNGADGAAHKTAPRMRESEDSLDLHRRCNNRFNERIWGPIMLDREGFRPNVGIILLNHKNQVFWGK